LERALLAENLRKLGLTGYEARCYVALVTLGPSHPRRVASEAGLPYPNAYEALRRLAQIGWVELVRKRPATYRARKPSSVKQMVASRVEETFSALEAVYNNTPAEEAELVYTIRGQERVLSKVVELMDGARESIILVSPPEGLVGSVIERLESALSRGVSIRVISDRGAGLPEGVEYRRGSPAAVDLFVDGSSVLISLPDYSACGWTDSPQVAYQFGQFLELMWESRRGGDATRST
jgi:sugar-specific transcriptional regulator TrmB